ncbi:MAG: hypothetical protein AAGA54_10585 [Myxococcota bacterium]
MSRAVVCIHGALRSRAGMLPTAAYLRRLGFDARTFGYPTRRGSLEDHGRRLDAFVRDWLPDPLPPLGFLTHSMGGLVVRAWLAQRSDAFDVRVAMLSPPNQGSALARANERNPLFHVLYGQAARALGVPDLPPVPANAKVLVLAGGRGTKEGYNPLLDGDDDGVVAVEEMGLPDAPPEFVGGMHAVLQWTPSILRRAADFLGAA